MRVPVRLLGAVAATLGVLSASDAWAGAGFRITSPDLPPGAPFPLAFVDSGFGCTGGNQSPALAWTEPPAGTKSFVVSLYDPARPPMSGWWHWVVYDVPAQVRDLPRGAGARDGGLLPQGAKQAAGDGDLPEHAYHGPCPDAGDPPHHYVLTLYALKVDHLDIPATATAADVDYAASAQLLGKASMVRSYGR